MKSFATWVLLSFAFVGCAHAQPRADDQRDLFTVTKSIEMTTFSDPFTRDPSAIGKISPDGLHFLIVTTRGLLKSNQLESILWSYRYSEVEAYLKGNLTTPPNRRLLLRVVSIPQAEQTDSYGSLINSVQWSSDSQSVLSLAETPGGQRHVFLTRLSTRQTKDITPGAAMDVQSYREASGTIAYLAREHVRSSANDPLGDPINASASVLTGSNLFHILFPESFPERTKFATALTLWIYHEGSRWQVNGANGSYFPIGAQFVRLSISPDGRSVIAAQPVADILPSWSNYESASNTYDFRVPFPGADRSGRSVEWPWQYAYIDVEKRTSRSLIEAPSNSLNGYGDIFLSGWSDDGQDVLLTSTYLPLGSADSAGQTHPTRPCAVAVYNRFSQRISCVALTRFPLQDEHLRFAGFVGSSHKVELRWLKDGNESKEVYERTEKGWMLGGSGTEEKPIHKATLSLRQDIDVPPSLWATDTSIHVSKLLWNPNPQLSTVHLGGTKIYRWKDSSGYVWRGGLVLPPDYVSGKRYPLVLQTHGFYNDHEFLADGSFTTGFAAQSLAATGIVVLQMEDRADRHSRPALEEAGLYVQGFEAAIKKLDDEGIVDPARVGIIGFSRTAWYVESALVNSPQLYRAATMIDGVDQSYVTYMLFATGNPFFARDHEASNGGPPFGAGLEKWENNAIGFHLDKVRTPLRIEAIRSLSILGEWETYSSLALQHKPVDLIYLPNGQHILQRPLERYASQQGNVDWFRFWLQGYERPDPEDTDQYRRWEHLRDMQDAEDKRTNATTPIVAPTAQ